MGFLCFFSVLQNCSVWALAEVQVRSSNLKFSLKPGEPARPALTASAWLTTLSPNVHGRGLQRPNLPPSPPPLLVLRVSGTSCSGVCGLGVSWHSHGGPMEGHGSLAKMRWLLRALTLPHSPWDAPAPRKWAFGVEGTPDGRAD